MLETNVGVLYVTEQEYLNHEVCAEERAEYRAGRVYPMSGARWNHNIISVNISTALKNQLSKRFFVLGSQMRVRIQIGPAYYYPDVSIVCGEPDILDNSGDNLLNPTVVVEASKSTERRDRGEKFDDYRTIPSMQAYLLVSQIRPHVELHLRQPDDSWELCVFDGVDASLAIPVINSTLKMGEIYDQVKFGHEERSRP